MTWSDRLLPASYRGVPFLVDSHEMTGGRRSQETEYPGSDEVDVQDLGAKGLEFRVNAIVFGEDYIDRRDRLIELLQRRSSGYPYRPGSPLVHPYLGSLEVLPTDFRVTETRREGRICRISITFKKAPGVPRPFKSADALAGADSAATELQDAAEATADAIDVDGPNSLVDSFAQGLSDIGRMIIKLDVFSGAVLDAAALALATTRLFDTASSLATSPADAIAATRSAVSGIFGAASNSQGALAAYEALFGFSVARDGGSSPTSKTIDANASRLELVIADFAIAGATRSAVRRDFDYLSQAEDARRRILDQLEVALEETDPRTVDALETVRVVLSAQVPRRPASLPKLETITLDETQPALVLAYRLYRNPDRDLEIAKRNSARLPGFLPPDTPLEVLSS